MSAPELSQMERLAVAGVNASPYAPESVVRQVVDAWAACMFSGAASDQISMAEVAVDVMAGRWKA